MKIVIDYLCDQPEFIPIVAKWYQREWGQYYPERTHEKWCALIPLGKTELPITLIALDKQEPTPRIIGVGTIRYGSEAIFHKKVIEIAGLYTPPANRGQGIANLLLNELCKLANALGHNEIELFTFGNGKLYQKNGWRQIDQVAYKNKCAAIYRKVF